MANLISEEFNITFSVKEIYDNPDIRRMAQYINKCIGDGEQKYDGVVLLKKSESKDNLFLVHAGNGSAAPYARLCSKISKDINCFAIPYPDDEIKEYPRVITMDYLAEKYVKIIRNIQPHGPYKLFGWCIGANIITEVIHKLEERGENVEEVYLVAALSPHLDNDKKYFNSETEKIILSSLISDDNIKTIIFNETTVEGIWEKFIQNCEA